MPVPSIRLSDEQWRYLEQIQTQKAPRFLSEKPPSAKTSQDQYTLARESFLRFQAVVSGRSRSQNIDNVDQARAILVQLGAHTPILADNGTHSRLERQLNEFVAKAAAELQLHSKDRTIVGLGAVGRDPRFARDAGQVAGRHGMAGAAGVGGVTLPQSEAISDVVTRGWRNLPGLLSYRNEGPVLLNALKAIPLSALPNRDALVREYDDFIKNNPILNTAAKRGKLADLLQTIKTHAVLLARANVKAYQDFSTLTDPWKGAAIPKSDLDSKEPLPSGGDRLEAYGLGLVTTTQSRAEQAAQGPAKTAINAETVKNIARDLVKESRRDALVGVYAGRPDRSAFESEFRVLYPRAEAVFRRVVSIAGQDFTIILGRVEQTTVRQLPAEAPRPAVVAIPADKPGDPTAIYGDKEVAALSGKSNTYEAQATNGVGEGVAPITHETLAIALAEYRAHPDPRKARKIITILLTLRQIELVNPAYKEDFLHGLIQAPERLAQLEALIKTHFTGSSGTLITTEELRAISNIARGLPSRPGHQGGKDKESKE